MRAALINGAVLTWQERGSGEPVLFLHGFPFDARLWEPQLEQLPAGWRGIALNLRGFGGSAAPGDAPLTMEQHAGDAVALLNHLSIRRAVVCGLSMGGYVALAMHRQSPARLRALVLSDTRAEPDTEEAKRQRLEQVTAIQAAGPTGMLSAMLPRLLAQRTREQRSEVVQAVERMMRETPSATLVRALQGLAMRPDARPGLARIAVPVLVIGGEEDLITPPAVLRELAAGIPGATLELLPGAGHVANLERAAEFGRALAHFLATTIPA